MANTEDWIREDFLALMLCYAANADMEIKKVEIDLIKEKAGPIHYKKAKHTFDTLSDNEVIELIIELKNRFYPDEEGSKKLDQHLNDLFKADGKVDDMERMIRIGIERLF